MKKWLIFFATFALLVCTSFLTYLYTHRTDFAAANLSRLFGTTAHVQNIVWSTEGITFSNITLDSLSCKQAIIQLPLSQQISLLFASAPVAIQKLIIHDITISSDNALQILVDNGRRNQITESSRTFTARQIQLDNCEIQLNSEPSSSDQMLVIIATALQAKIR